MKIRFILAIAALGVFGLAASAQAQDKALIEKGMKVYDAQKCSICHSITGKGGNAKGPLDGVGTKLSEADIRLWMTDPKAATAKAKATRTPPMKAFTSLPKEDMDAVVAYMVSLKKK